jgi:fatty-acyl-CoA synthase
MTHTIQDHPHHAFWPARLPRQLYVPRTTVWANLEISALRYPDKTAYIFLGREISFGELHREATALAGWLQQEAGIEPGDRVLLFTQNCPQYVIGYYAILRAQGVVVPVNPMNKADELTHYITNAGATVAPWGRGWVARSQAVRASGSTRLSSTSSKGGSLSA